MIPKTYAEWHHCITAACGIKLTAAFIEARIRTLKNKYDSGTQIFIHLYGEQHYENVLSWFYQAQQPAKQ